MEYRPLGKTDIQVSAVALGCWPIAGMTSLDVNEADSLATLQACFDVGINFLDTAFAYGRDGESERLIARAIKGRRDQVVIAKPLGDLRRRQWLCRLLSLWLVDCERNLIRVEEGFDVVKECARILESHAQVWVTV